MIQEQDLFLEDIKNCRKVGFVTTFIANYKGSPVFVKELDTTLWSADAEKELITHRELSELTNKKSFYVFTSKHDYIVSLLSYSVNTESIKLVMEYAPHGTVGMYVSKYPEQGRSIILGIASAINWLHSVGYVHRDIKVENVVVSRTKRPKLCDFGTTEKINQCREEKVGTAHYMAPEIVNSNVYTEKADVYSFGLLMLELITNEKPFLDKTNFEVEELKKKGYRPYIPAGPDDICVLINSCLEFLPCARPNISVLIKYMESLFPVTNNKFQFFAAKPKCESTLSVSSTPAII